MIKNENPAMLEEVWKMKESVYNVIKEMSAKEIFNYVNNKSNKFLKRPSPSSKIIPQLSSPPKQQNKLTKDASMKSRK